MRFNEFELDEADARLTRAGQAVPLAPKPFAVLCVLARTPRSLVTKNALLDSVWGHRFVTESVLKSTISELRAALQDDAKQPRYIETVSRRGYRFIAPLNAPPAAPMPVSLAQAAPSIIGRAQPLEGLRTAWQAANAGRRRLVWIAGEAGVGKTTLIERFIAEVGDVHCAHGQCVEQYGGGEPYLPVLEALTAACKRDRALADLIRSVAPTWLLHLPWLSTAEERNVLRRDLAGSGQTRMLRELGELLDRYTESRPLLLVTEDLHWSDQATVQLMDYFARRRSPARVLWVASFRLTEIIAGEHPLRAARNELRLHGLVEEIVLDAFSEQEVAQYVAARMPALAADEKFVRRLYGRTDGLPLFVADAVNDAVTGTAKNGAMSVPKGLSGIIERYIRELQPAERALLEAASVCGVDFSLATLAALLERPIADVAESCAELARRQRWLTQGERRYSFRHALYREVLYGRIAPVKRGELHRQVAGALESGQAQVPASAAELAFHFEQGEDYYSALRYYAAAAESALLSFSPADTMSLTERGLSLLDRVDASPHRSRLEITLAALQGAGAIHMLGVGSVEAKHAYQRAESLLQQAPDHPLRGVFLHGLGIVLWMRGELDEAKALAERTAALASNSGDATTRICACLVHGIVEFAQGRPRTARDWLEEALSLVGAMDETAPPALFAADPVVIVLGLLALALTNLGLYEEARARIEEADARAGALRAPGPQMVAVWFAAFAEARMGNAEAVAELSARMLALVEEYALLPHARAVHLWLHGWARSRLGDPRAGYELIREGLGQAEAFHLRGLMSEAHAYAAEALADAKDWPQARIHLDQAVAIAEAVGERQHGEQLSRLAARIAARDDAAQLA